MENVWIIWVILVVILWLAFVLFLAHLPGKLARERHHPYADLIAVLGWLGILIPISWVVAIVWAVVGSQQRSLPR